MHGTIRFDNAESLAEFLRAFCPSTAIFSVTQEGNQYVLKFTGGY